MLKKIYNYINNKNNRNTISYTAVFSIVGMSLLSVYITDNLGENGLIIVYILQTIAYLMLGILLFILGFNFWLKIKEVANGKNNNDSSN